MLRLNHDQASQDGDETLEVDIPVIPTSVIVTAKEADKAAKVAGMRTIKASKFKGIATFGQWVEQNGALRTGLGLIAFTADQLQESLEQAAELDKELQDPEQRVNLIGIKRDLTEQLLDLAKALLKAGEKNVTASQPPAAQVPGPPPGMAINVQAGAAIQINSASKEHKG